ncbi:hypothetical protein A2Z22_01275 [Candidatus Woesebacteria bacterium RBG_16_34_12]|uniref:Phosphatidic acid phosphatase type 2/haloperoxidase domain-containing protein n=1 Tax=Candidatus Woesebacteria bacterium RBG_16_34_12 TaxID=1802480 RepID=A0A1F7X8P4_9BACT|nr:MAG: hypothetical protein A2Z22_01275 [Candidatus Woesebacteria bacterium RBG_16_34_12]
MNNNLIIQQPSWVVTFFASFLIWFMFAALVIIWLFHGRFEKRYVLNALLASFIAWIVSETIKQFFPTLRPFQVTGVAPLTLTIPQDSAFPSGHTSTAFALALSISKYNKKIGLFYVVLASLVGISRVIGRVHYFIDVFAGAFIGVISVTFLTKIDNLKYIKNRF